MHIHALRLHAYGRFEDKLLNFAEPGKLSLVYGPNEAGKSTALFALESFLFGLMDQRVAVSYEKAWVKSKLKVTGWLSASGAHDDVAEILRSHTAPSDREKLGREVWLPAKGQREMFKELFALDGERLRKQAERLLAVDSDAAQALGATLLGEQIEQQCRRLDTESEALFKERGKNQVIATLRRELADLDEKIRDQALSKQDWEAQDQAAKQAKQRAEELARERDQTKAQIRQLEQDTKRLQARARLKLLQDELQALLAQHPGLPLLTKAELSKVETIDRQQSEVAGRIQQLQAQQQDLIEKQQKLSLNKDLWVLHETMLAQDGEGLKQLARRLSDWRALLDARPQEARDLGPLSVEHARLLEQESELLRLQATLQESPDLPAEPQPPALSGMLSRLSLDQLGAVLDPSLALSDRLKSWQDQRAQQNRQALEIDTQARAAQRALEEAEGICQQLKSQGAGLDGQALVEARRQRELLWDDLKRDLGDFDLQRRFEQAQTEADRHADALARSERHAGAWQNALDQQSRAELAVATCHKQRQTLQQDMSEMLGAILELPGTEALREGELDTERGLDQALALLAAVLAFEPQWRAWKAQRQRWQEVSRHWSALEKQGQVLGFEPRSAVAGLRGWLKNQMQSLQQVKRDHEARKRWHGYQQRVESEQQHLQALADKAASIEIGAGLEAVATVRLLQEAFEREAKEREQQARLQTDLQRTQIDLTAQQTLEAQFAEQRARLLDPKWQDLEVLRGASLAEANRKEQQDVVADIGAPERWQTMEAAAEARQTLDQAQRQQEEALAEAYTAEGVERQALKTLMQADGARDLRFERRAKLEALRQAVTQYLDLGLQGQVLRRALNRFLEQQQDGLLSAASQTFTKLTDGAYQEIDQRRADDGKVHFWTRDNLGDDKDLSTLSEGTKDQLYLSLRLAALDQYGLEQLRTSAGVLPLICDDLLVQYDDSRAARALEVLAERRERQQVIYFTHHRHLLELAEQHLDKDSYAVMDLTLNDAEPR